MRALVSYCATTTTATVAPTVAPTVSPTVTVLSDTNTTSTSNGGDYGLSFCLSVFGSGSIR